MRQLRSGGFYIHLMGKAEEKVRVRLVEGATLQQSEHWQLSILLKWGVLTMTQEVLTSDV